MKLSTLFGSLLLPVFLFPWAARAAQEGGWRRIPPGTPLEAPAMQEVWLAPRTDSVPGRGTQASPYDAGSAEKFDALMHRFFDLKATDIVFHLAPGIYYTMGAAGKWRCLSDWKFHGAGMDLTEIKLAGWEYVPDGQGGRNTAIEVEQAFRSGIEITDLTIDCSWLDFGSRLAGPFTQPAQDQAVTVPVLSSTWARVGKYAYLQRMDDYSEVGTYEVTAVPDTGHVTVKNLSRFADNMAPDTKVSGPVYVGPAVNTCAIDIGAKNCDVERVHVTNSGTPMYEGGLGITIAHLNFKQSKFALAEGNVIRQCLLDNLWGRHGSCITVLSNNPDIQDGTFISAIVEDNVIHSNGWHQGLGCYGTANSIWAHNVVTDCRMGWFVDVGYNQDDQIRDNTFINNNGGIQLGGGYVNGWLRFNISGNHIVVKKGGSGILFNGEVHQSVFSNNQILAPEGAPRSGAIGVNPKATEGNVFYNNVVSSILENSIPAGTAACFNNVTENGTPITVGK